MNKILVTCIVFTCFIPNCFATAPKVNVIRNLLTDDINGTQSKSKKVPLQSKQTNNKTNNSTSTGEYIAPANPNAKKAIVKEEKKIPLPPGLKIVEIYPSGTIQYSDDTFRYPDDWIPNRRYSIDGLKSYDDPTNNHPAYTYSKDFYDKNNSWKNLESVPPLSLFNPNEDWASMSYTDLLTQIIQSNLNKKYPAARYPYDYDSYAAELNSLGIGKGKVPEDRIGNEDLYVNSEDSTDRFDNYMYYLQHRDIFDKYKDPEQAKKALFKKMKEEGYPYDYEEVGIGDIWNTPRSQYKYFVDPVDARKVAQNYYNNYKKAVYNGDIYVRGLVPGNNEENEKKIRESFNTFLGYISTPRKDDPPINIKDDETGAILHVGTNTPYGVSHMRLRKFLKQIKYKPTPTLTNIKEKKVKNKKITLKKILKDIMIYLGF
jgi:hypothetical protein